MFCTCCGKELKEKFNFCPYCGAQLNRNADIKYSYIKNNKKKATLVKVMVKGGLTKELYYLDGNYFYDEELLKPFNKDDLYKMEVKAPNMVFIGGKGMSPLLGTMVYGAYNNVFKKKG